MECQKKSEIKKEIKIERDTDTERKREKEEKAKGRKVGGRKINGDNEFGGMVMVKEGAKREVEKREANVVKTGPNDQMHIASQRGW